MALEELKKTIKEQLSVQGRIYWHLLLILWSFALWLISPMSALFPPLYFMRGPTCWY